MRLDVDVLKSHLSRFANECGLTITEIGNLADESFSVDDFKRRLDESCSKTIGKTSLEVLAGFVVKLPISKTYSEPQQAENSALQNELVEVRGKIDRLNEKDKPQQAETKP